MSSLDDIRTNWEGFARTDPFWSILSDDSKQGDRWNKEEFFATGRQEIATVFNYLKSMGISAQVEGEALDFGCGVGRLTQALAEKFNRCAGVDIASKMVEMARKFNSYPERVSYHLNTTGDLSQFKSNTFAFIYTSIVLQHIPTQYTKEYLIEFVRVLKPGGVLVFQIPDRFIEPENIEGANSNKSCGPVQSIKNKLLLRTRLKRLLEATSLLPTKQTYKMEMNSIPQDSISKIMNTAQSEIIGVKLTNSTDAAFNGNLRFLDCEPETGWVSKQYCVRKLSPAQPI